MANHDHVIIVLQGVDAIREWRRNNPIEHLDLAGANLVDADLSGADLSEAVLVEANLRGANLSGADLALADLREAGLSYSILRSVNIPRADLVDARLGETSFVGCGLSDAKGLETVRHERPSHVDVDTLSISFRSAGNKFTPELKMFFTKAGVPEELLNALPQILAEIKYCRTFVAYGEPDRGFAERLVDDLRSRGVPCWIYPTDHTVGERIWCEIDQSRREAEKMVVLCSAKSLICDGLLKEVKTQMDEDPDKMVPVSLDTLWQEKGFLVMRAGRDLKPFLLGKNYANFHSEPDYEKSLSKLLKGLGQNIGLKG